MALVSIIFFGVVILTLFAAIGFVLKLTFKLVLLPVTLLWWLVKGVLLLVGIALAIAFAPVALVLLLIALPLLLIVGLFGAGFALVT
jgi:hypothetical protein